MRYSWLFSSGYWAKKLPNSISWALRLRTAPPPWVKQYVIWRLSRKYRCEALVETGTFRGDTPYRLKVFFKEIFTIELDKNLFEAATEVAPEI